MDITLVPDGGFKTMERALTRVITILPFLAFLVSIFVFWNRGIGFLDLSLFLATYTLTGLGVTVGFHRYLTHRSFRARRWVRGALAIAGSLAVEGSVIKWVADHRRHHAFSDRPGDPHSPHLEDAEGVRGVLKGLWHAHVGWFFDAETTNVTRFASDLLKDGMIRKIDALTPLWVTVSFALPPLIGLAVTRSISGSLTALLWGSLVRIFFLHHVTWSINSICHFFGKRPFETIDQSTNNWLLSLVSFGEAWHNNHHAFPSSAVHGIQRGQFDSSWLLIRVMESLGLIYDVKRPSVQELERKRAS